MHARLRTLWWLAAALSGAHAATFFVAPDGSDAAPGTQAQPFATVARAQQAVAPGDTVNFRGGTYVLTEAQIARRREIYADVILLDKSGQPGAPITWQGFAGERAVFDFSRVKPAGLRVTAFEVTGSWLQLKRFEVVGVQVTLRGHTQSICVAPEGDHNLFEQLSLHDGQGIGIYLVRGAHNLFLNCDAWRNWDPVSEDGKGGNTDGFGCHPSPRSVGNVFRGCRAWYNSDDGYDCISARESVVFENCWALYNGLWPDGRKLGDGNGFKAGGYGSTPVAKLPTPIPRHTVRGCVAVGNRAGGFYANHHLAGGDWLFNTAFRNGTDFNMLRRLPDNRTDVPGTDHQLIGNVAYRGHTALARCEVARCHLERNTFEPALKLTDADFLSLDEAQLLGPRQPDGSLPAVTFMHPTDTSPAKGLGAWAWIPPPV